MRSLVHGFAIAGESTAVALGGMATRSRLPTMPSIQQKSSVLLTRVSPGSLPDGDALDAFVRQFDLIAPAPGVPEHHYLIECAQREGVTISSEIEIAYATEQQRDGGPRPILAVTGTDGKTTTCELAVAMLRAGGIHSLAVGTQTCPSSKLLSSLSMRT